MDSSSHPLYLDKEYDTKESFLAACIKHNASVGKECKTYPSNSKRARVTCCDASCEVSLMGDTLPFTIFVHLFCSPSYFSFLPVMTVLCVVSVQEEAGKMESDIT